MKMFALPILFFSLFAFAQEMPARSGRRGPPPEDSEMSDMGESGDMGKLGKAGKKSRSSTGECRKQDRQIEKLEKELAEAESRNDELLEVLLAAKTRGSRGQMEGGMGANTTMNPLAFMGGSSMGNSGMNSALQLMMQQQMWQQQMMMQMQYSGSLGYSNIGSRSGYPSTSTTYGGTISSPTGAIGNSFGSR